MAKKKESALDRERMLALYRTMLTIRRCEEQLVKMYAAGKLYGGVHTYIGEEAVAAGVCAHLTNEDKVFSTHRGHGHALAKGVPPRELIAEVMGRATGCSGGRGGSMHLFKPEVGFMGSSGIVAGGIGLAAGAGYASLILKNGTVGVSFFGDGASNNGVFHEAINMAGAFGLPSLFVCENNLYATEVPLTKVTRSPSIAGRGEALGVASAVVDGNDVCAVYEAAGEAVRRARAGEGPTLLECRTYRTRAHSEGMRDTGYRTPEEVAAWKARDPIMLLAKRLLAEHPDAQADMDRTDAELKATVEEAASFALASPQPDASTVMDHVYSV